MTTTIVLRVACHIATAFSPRARLQYNDNGSSFSKQLNIDHLPCILSLLKNAMRLAYDHNAAVITLAGEHWCLSCSVELPRFERFVNSCRLPPHPLSPHVHTHTPHTHLDSLSGSVCSGIFCSISSPHHDLWVQDNEFLCVTQYRVVLGSLFSGGPQQCDLIYHCLLKLCMVVKFFFKCILIFLSGKAFRLKNKKYKIRITQVSDVCLYHEECISFGTSSQFM